jgi:hypothetical protein
MRSSIAIARVGSNLPSHSYLSGIEMLWQPFLGRCCMPVSLIISFPIKRKGREIWVEVLRSALTRLHRHDVLRHLD